MTDYLSYNPQEFQPDAPATALHFQRWFENWIAGFEGAPGAPRLQAEALATQGSGLPVLTVTASDAFTIGHGIAVVQGALSASGVTDVVAWTLTVISYTGSIRWRISHSGSTATSTLSLFKNGVLVTSFTATFTTARTVDVSVVPGDVLQWRHRSSNAVSVSVSARSETASNAYQDTPVWRRAL